MTQVTIQQAFDLAVRHHQADRLADAEQLFRQILAQQPEHAGAIQHLGVLAHQVGQNDLAENLIRRAIELKPDYAEAYTNLGQVLRGNGQVDAAIEAFRQAIVLKPTLSEAHFNLGAALNSHGRIDEAISAYRQAIAINPDYAAALNNLGVVLKGKDQLDDAVAVLRRAIAVDPRLPDAYCNLGNVLKEKGQLNEAIVACRRAIDLRPDYPEAHNNLGNALGNQGNPDDAIAAYRQAIALRPNFAEAHGNLAGALGAKGLLKEAVATFRYALAIDPTNYRIDSNLVYTLQFLPEYSAQAIGEEHRRWNRQHAEPLHKFIRPHANDRNPERRLRIGYVSPDFRFHPVGRFMAPLLASHDHKEFEIFCYAHVPTPDEWTIELHRHADQWRNIVGQSDEQVAGQIRHDGIDILVDLALHSAYHRLLVFARKPAPVQVSYLGGCGTTGMTTLDYRLSDSHLDPPDSDLSVYSEKTVRLPKTYWCYQSNPSPDPAPSPAKCGGIVTFGCLNHFSKVSTAALDLWSRILIAVPNSRLLVCAPSGRHLSDTTNRMERAGVQQDRLVFVEKKPWSQYLETYSQIDIALDPYPYGGGTTTCDALWMGVPVVTLSGQTVAGRAGRSILSNVGLTELIAFTPDQYVQIAIDLAHDQVRMDELRRTMRDRMLASPLMDAAGFARDVEAAYRRMWDAWLNT